MNKYSFSVESIYPFSDISVIPSGVISNSSFLDAFILISEKYNQMYLRSFEKSNTGLNFTFLAKDRNNVVSPFEFTTGEILFVDLLDRNEFVLRYLNAVKVIYVKFVVSIELENIPDGIYNLNDLEFNAICVRQSHTFLKSLTFETSSSDGLTYSPVVTKTSNINLKEGFNIGFSPGVNLDVNPGIGAGLYDDCSNLLPIAALNKIKPDENGNVFISGDQCFRLNQLYSNGFRVENHCNPICEHEEIDSLAHYINRLTDAAKQLGIKCRKLYYEAVAKFKDKGIASWDAALPGGGALLNNYPAISSDVAVGGPKSGEGLDQGIYGKRFGGLVFNKPELRVPVFAYKLAGVISSGKPYLHLVVSMHNPTSSNVSADITIESMLRGSSALPLVPADYYNALEIFLFDRFFVTYKGKIEVVYNNLSTYNAGGGVPLNDPYRPMRIILPTGYENPVDPANPPTRLTSAELFTLKPNETILFRTILVRNGRKVGSPELTPPTGYDYQIRLTSSNLFYFDPQLPPDVTIENPNSYFPDPLPYSFTSPINTVTLEGRIEETK